MSADAAPSPTHLTGPAADPETSPAFDVGEELLVEEVSIDGMCGVY